MGNNKTVTSNASLTLSDFLNAAPAKANSATSGFDASKMSGKPCTKKQAFAVACIVKDSFIKDVFEVDPRESISEAKIIKSFEYRILQRIARVLFDTPKFDSDQCQIHFKDNAKSLSKPILKRITKSFKEHNQDKDSIDKFFMAVHTKL